MYEVDGLFSGDEFRTAVWIAEPAQEALAGFAGGIEGKRFLKKLEYYAKAGFGNFEGKGLPIRHEWDGVYRVAHSASLFRLIGFYDEPGKACFIAIEAFLKSGKKLKSPERDRINDVARVKRDHAWEKRLP